MATQQITAKQILSGTITTTQLAAAAGIADGQLANPYLYASGARSLAGVLNGGGFEAQNFAAPTAGGSLTTKSYVDGVAAGLSPKPSARAATVGTENYTVLAGTVTQITGTTVDGVAPAINDYILVKDAPAASGVGSVMSSQPGNGLYQVTSIVSNLAVSRATQMSGGNGPAGAYVFVEGGTVNAAAGYVVSVPSSNTGFTYGTNNIQWTQFSGAGEITVDATLVKTGNQLARAAIAGDVSIPAASNTATIANSAVGLAKMANLVANQIIGNATGGSAAPQSLNVGGGLEFTAGGIQRSALTGDVTAAAGSNAATIANSAVTLAKLANLAANSVIANITGSAAVPAAVAAVVTATANSVVVRDANANTKANAFISGTSSTVTAGATTTLTAASTAQQLFTGTAAQTCVLPDATALALPVTVTAGSVTTAANEFMYAMLGGWQSSTHGSWTWSASTVAGGATLGADIDQGLRGVDKKF
jgi:hypothetical protein